MSAEPKADPNRVVIASRGSKLALHQTGLMADRLRSAHPSLAFEIKVVKSEADRRPDAPLAQISGEGIFVKELERSLLDGDSDLAVHSLKDMPVAISKGLVLAAIPEREDPRDALISPSGRKLADLPSGARIGSASPRRAIQLNALRPDLEVVPVRGNIDTRLRKAASGELDGIVLAAAALRRMGWEDRITELLQVEDCLPAPGQGALAIEAREDDGAARRIAAALDDASTRASVTAERTFLGALGGGCRAPIAAWAKPEGGSLRLAGLAASPDGSRILRDAVEGPAADAEVLGRELARKLLDRGARDFLPRA